jgi:hypothetical protein
MEEHEDVVTYKMPMNVLNDMCHYQSMINELHEYVKGDVVVKKYNIIKEKRTGAIRTSISWKAGTPMLFPPHLNYVQVEEEENAQKMIDSLRMIKDNPYAIYMFDKELAARTYTQASPLVTAGE